MEDKEFNPAQSLELIQSMINSAKNRLADDGFYIIFWGWLVFVAAMINYVCWIFDLNEGALVWPILMPLGAIVSTIYGRKRNRNQKVKTKIDSYLNYVWIATGIAMAICLLFMPLHGIKITYFILMMLYGIGTMISGGLLSFKPLIVGSFFAFAIAAISVFAGEREQLLCLALSLLCSYIVPGHMLKLKFQSQNNV